jgi:N-6 DNA Methylase
MNTEQIVISLLKSYDDLGLKPTNVNERILFLSLLSLLLTCKVQREDDAIARAVTLIFSRDFGQLPAATTKLTSLQKEIVSTICQNLNEVNCLKTIDKIKCLADEHMLSELDAMEAIRLYQRVLQRLQRMNVPDRKSLTFTYEEFPSELVSLTQSLLGDKKPTSLCDPWANSGEFVCYLAALTKPTTVTTNSIHQSPAYIKHMLLIAGVENAICTAVNGDNFPESKQDVCITVAEPSSKAGVDRERDVVKHLISCIKKDGSVIALLGKGILHRKSDTPLREELLTKNLVSCIVELPPKLLSKNTVQLFALVLNNQNANKEVLFIDASNHCQMQAKLNVLKSVPDLCDLRCSEEIRFSSISTKQIMKQKEVLLTPGSYQVNVVPDNAITSINAVREKLIEIQARNDKEMELIDALLK